MPNVCWTIPAVSMAQTGDCRTRTDAEASAKGLFLVHWLSTATLVLVVDVSHDVRRFDYVSKFKTPPIWPAFGSDFESQAANVWEGSFRNCRCPECTVRVLTSQRRCSVLILKAVFKREMGEELQLVVHLTPQISATEGMK